MSDKIVFTVPGYKIIKDLQNEILETKELESKYSETHKSHRKDANKNNFFSLNSQKKPTFMFADLASPTNQNLLTSMKENLNITSLLLKTNKPQTANPQLTNERLKTFTLNSNFSTTNNFFSGKQTVAQNLDVTTLSRIVIRNSKKTKTPVNVNETRHSMVPAGHTGLPSLKKEENLLISSTNSNAKHELLRLRHDEAKLEKIIASTNQKKKEFEEVDELVKKKLHDKLELNREYFNKKDPKIEVFKYIITHPFYLKKSISLYLGRYHSLSSTSSSSLSTW